MFQFDDKKLRKYIGLSYDDVLLVPKKSNIKSRRLVDVRTKLTKNVSLNIPIVSAGMDSVTESEMAIAMARLGGIGEIHRFMSIERQAEEVKKVKRADNFIIREPYSVTPETSIEEAKKIMEQKKVSGLIVVDNENNFQGILSKRDILFCEDENKKVKDLMTPRERVKYLRKESVSLEEAINFFRENKVEKLILLKNGKLNGLVTVKDIKKRLIYKNSVRDKQGRLLVSAAVGVLDYKERVPALINAGVDVLMIDVAHGHHEMVFETLSWIKEKYPEVDVVAGNVATPEAVKDLIDAGADAVKVGIGPGSVCTTRVVAGAGVPQFTAVLECSKVAHKKKIPIIADGGIKNSGDIVKALGAGASSVMIGRLLAGTEEAPGRTIIKNGMKYKYFRGMASFEAAISRAEKAGDKNSLNAEPEGVESYVPYQGTVKEVVEKLVAGVRSGISYAGALNIEEFWKKAEFTVITPGGVRESKPHDVFLK